VNTLFYVAFEEMCFSGKNAWVSNLYYPGIYHIDLETLTVSLEAFIPDCLVAGSHTAIAYSENKLILAPNNANNILVYDLESKQYIQNIDISRLIMVDHSQLFKQIIINGNDAILIPGRANCILIMEMDTYKIREIDLSKWNISRYVHDSNRILFRRGHIGRNNELMLPCFQDGKIILINGDTCEIIDVGNDSLTDVFEHGDAMYCVLRDKPQVIKYDINSREKSIIDLSGIDGKMQAGFGKGILFEGKLFLAPRLGNYVLSLDLIFETISSVAELPLEYIDESLNIGMVNIMGFYLYNGILIGDSCRDGKLIVVRLNGENICKPLIVDDDGQRRIMKRIWNMENCNGMFNERINFTIETMLEYIL